MVDHPQWWAPTSSIKNYLSEVPKARNHLIITFVKIVVDEEPIGLLPRHTHTHYSVSVTHCNFINIFETAETIHSFD